MATLALSTIGAAGGAAAQQGPGQAQAIDTSWLKADSSTRAVTFELIAGLTGLNGALNFNGFHDGGLTVTVPRGWTVIINFRNHDVMLPHSAVVINDVRPIPVQAPQTAFDRAFTLKMADGLPFEGTDSFRFIANRAGTFLIFCGVPGHGAAGMWIRLVVSGSMRLPSLSRS